jgi:hypothetical protein
MDLLVIFQKLGIALGLGLPVGLQREYAASQMAGTGHPSPPIVPASGAV